MIRCNTPVRLRKPRRISISPTESSIVNPSRGGMATLNSMIAAPTRKIVSV